CSIPLDAMNLMVITKGKDKNDNILSLRALDIIGGGGLRKKYFEKIGEVPLKNFILPGLFLAYDYAMAKYVDSGEKKRFNFTEQDLQNYLKRYFENEELIVV
ncbi:MAG: hypothetical protein NC817_01625, partial [Candidatus Omnitrophica bacterium]|nr:hypothetical protein [Candidatus Omnitrophota bacterium]